MLADSYKHKACYLLSIACNFLMRSIHTLSAALLLSHGAAWLLLLGDALVHPVYPAYAIGLGLALGVPAMLLAAGLLSAGGWGSSRHDLKHRSLLWIEPGAGLLLLLQGSVILAALLHILWAGELTRFALISVALVLLMLGSAPVAVGLLLLQQTRRNSSTPRAIDRLVQHHAASWLLIYGGLVLLICLSIFNADDSNQQFHWLLSVLLSLPAIAAGL